MTADESNGARVVWQRDKRGVVRALIISDATGAPLYDTSTADNPAQALHDAIARVRTFNATDPYGPHLPSEREVLRWYFEC